MSDDDVLKTDPNPPGFLQRTFARTMLSPSSGTYASTLVTWARQRFWILMYDFMSYFTFSTENWSYMNYGYIPADGVVVTAVQITEEEQAEKCGVSSIQLYHHVVTNAVNIEGKHVLEVGSGRGGGASYLARYWKPKTMTGVDLSSQTVAVANQIHKHVNNLHFMTGSADALPLPDASVDVVVNVESSHCYPSFLAFLKEVDRVLRPDGYLVLADFRLKIDMDDFETDFAKAGFEIKEREDITEGVVRSMKASSQLRLRTMKEAFQSVYFFGEWVLLPILGRWFKTFAAVEGSGMNRAMTVGRLVYVRYVLQKKESSKKTD